MRGPIQYFSNPAQGCVAAPEGIGLAGNYPIFLQYQAFHFLSVLTRVNPILENKQRSINRIIKLIKWKLKELIAAVLFNPMKY